MKKEIMGESCLLDESIICNLDELCEFCNISNELVLEMINEGVISPVKEDEQWQFGHMEIHRLQIAVRLQRDLRINLPGVALALDLLEELTELRQLFRRQMTDERINRLEFR